MIPHSDDAPTSPRDDGSVTAQGPASSEPLGTRATTLEVARRRRLAVVAPTSGPGEPYASVAAIGGLLDDGIDVLADLSRLTPGDGMAAEGPIGLLRLIDAIAPDTDPPRCHAGLRIDHPDLPRLLEDLRARGAPLRTTLQVAVTDDFLEAAERNRHHHYLDPATVATTNTVLASRLLSELTNTQWLCGAPDLFLVDRADDARSAEGSNAGPVVVYDPVTGSAYPAGAASEHPAPQMVSDERVTWRATDDAAEALRRLVVGTDTYLRVPKRRAPRPEIPHVPLRERPVVSAGWTHQVDTACGIVYVTINIDENGPVDLHASRAKANACTHAQFEATSRLASLAMRGGIDPERIVEALRGTRCGEPVVTDHGIVHGCVDAIGRALERQLLGPDGPQHPVQRQEPLDRFTHPA